MTGLKPGFSISCPRCVQGMPRGGACCPHCGYSLGEADAHFGGGPVAVECLTDADGLFTAEEREAIAVVQREFERRFPQLFLMIYAGSLPPPASPRQFGFWLLNQAAVPFLDVTRPNENGLLLVIDPSGGTAALTAGYFAESCLGQEALNSVLEAGRKAFVKARYVQAVRDVAASLTRRLCQVARKVAKSRPPVLPAAGGGTFPAVLRLKSSAAAPETEAVQESVISDGEGEVLMPALPESPEERTVMTALPVSEGERRLEE